MSQQSMFGAGGLEKSWRDAGHLFTLEAWSWLLASVKECSWSSNASSNGPGTTKQKNFPVGVKAKRQKANLSSCIAWSVLPPEGDTYIYGGLFPLHIVWSRKVLKKECTADFYLISDPVRSTMRINVPKRTSQCRLKGFPAVWGRGIQSDLHWWMHPVLTGR